MRAPKSKLGLGIVAAYLLLVLAACLPLIYDGAIHHGNGIAFLAAALLTSPLSWLTFWAIDSLTRANAFYLTGNSYFLYMGALAACAAVNAVALYFLASWLGRFIAKRFGRRVKLPLD
jgi:hypothetical protein